MISVLVFSAVDHGFEPRWSQIIDCKIVICCFSVRHGALRSKNKDLLARIQDNATEWNNMSTRGL